MFALVGAVSAIAGCEGKEDRDAAQAVAGSGAVEHYQVLDQLSLLVDKSLLVADKSGGRTRVRCHCERASVYIRNIGPRSLREHH